MEKFLLCLIIVASPIMAMEDIVEMPGRKELEQRVVEHGLGHFASITDIINLAGTHKTVSEIVEAVEHASQDYLVNIMHADRIASAWFSRKMYVVNITKEEVNTFMMSKPQIFEALLKDYPQALRELRRQGIYTGSYGVIKGIATND